MRPPNETTNYSLHVPPVEIIEVRYRRIRPLGYDRLEQLHNVSIDRQFEIHIGWWQYAYQERIING
jgi:hypothetical protein